MAITANNMIPVGFSFEESNFENALMNAMAVQTRKYNTNVSLTPNTFTIAPVIITDAILAANCTATQVCEVPKVLTNSRIQMNEACNICLTDLSEGEAVVYGVDLNNPLPTPGLDAQKSKEQSVKLAFSMLKTYWLGDKSYIAADLRNPLLLNAYKKDDGQWKKILASVPPRVEITQNAGITPAAQSLTYEEALAYIDATIDAQSVSLEMVMNSEKNIWATVELFDVIQTQRAKNDLAGIRFVTIENEFGNFDSFVYRDVQVVKYEHFSNAIKDLAPSTAGTIEQPHRLIFTVGLPMLSFPLPQEGTFTTEYNEATRAYTAGTLATILHPEAVAGDYYVVAY